MLLQRLNKAERLNPLESFGEEFMTEVIIREATADDDVVT